MVLFACIISFMLGWIACKVCARIDEKKGESKMKTIIKIHDTQWFKKHCKVIAKYDTFVALMPKYSCWDSQVDGFVSWLSGSNMSYLEGMVLEVDKDEPKALSHVSMSGSRYYAEGYWIPNWAIEWVKEEQK